MHACCYLLRLFTPEEHEVLLSPLFCKICIPNMEYIHWRPCRDVCIVFNTLLIHQELHKQIRLHTYNQPFHSWRHAIEIYPACLLFIRCRHNYMQVWIFQHLLSFCQLKRQWRCLSQHFIGPDFSKFSIWTNLCRQKCAYICATPHYQSNVLAYSLSCSNWALKSIDQLMLYGELLDTGRYTHRESFHYHTCMHRRPSKISNLTIAHTPHEATLQQRTLCILTV